MFNAIVEEEEEKSDVEVDDDKSKMLKEKLAQSIEDIKSELKEELKESLKEISSEQAKPEPKEKKQIWTIGMFGVVTSVSLLFSALMALFVFFNAILGRFPGGLFGESNFGDKFYYYVAFEKMTGAYPESSSFIRPTWEFAGTLTVQDFILIGLSGLFLFITFIKLELRGFKLFSTGEAVENASEGTEEVFGSSKVLIFGILIMYLMTVIGAFIVDNRVVESETLILAPGESNLIELGEVHTISWQIKVNDIGENSSYSMFVMDEFNCERFSEGNSISSLTSVDMWSKSDLVASDAINPKRDARDNYCALLLSDVNSEFPMELTYKVNAQ
ncbi:MAG: Uncharacterised protein [Methanobacteriota archaeon]|nr:MAG: Uncharacterised protein [Euryarchaeota archaeon]